MSAFRSTSRGVALGLGLALVTSVVPAAQAQIAVSANDGRAKLEDGKVVVDKTGVDTITLIDLAATPPKAVGELPVPASVAGPPSSVALTPNEELALVTSALKHDPADPTKQVPNDIVSVVELNRASGVGGIVNRIRGKQAQPAYAPKIIAIFVSLLLFLPLMGAMLGGFMREIAGRIAGM